MCVNFQVKQTTLTFSAQFRPKMDLELEIQKINVEIRIIILEILCVPIFRQNENLWLFLTQICPKVDLGLKILDTNLGIRINMLEILCVPIFRDNFDFFGPNLPKNGFLGRNFKNLSPDLESACPRYHACQFSGKWTTLNFPPRFGEIAQLHVIFWFW